MNIIDYMIRIQKSESDLSVVLTRISSLNQQLLAYDQELDDLTSKLREKHDYHRITEGITAGKVMVSQFETGLLQDRIFVVLLLISDLIRSDWSRACGALDMLRQDWGVDIVREGDISDEKYANYVCDFIDSVCNPDWWAKRDVTVQSNNYIWLYGAEGQERLPHVNIGIKTDVLDRLPEFQKWAADKSKEFSKAWAAQYVANSPEAQQRALFDALVVKYGRYND